MNGPAISVMPINIDMLSYKSGVYTKGEEVPKFSGFQSVKIVGWGVESGSEDEPNKGNRYWIVQNTWGEDWGTNGEIKIATTKSQDYLFEQFAYSIRNKDAKPKPTVVDSLPKETEEAKIPETENLDLENDAGKQK